MPKIHLLDKSVAELIAAGEVVERPASVIKELVENSIDAGATKITVEIENGGITLMRVTDNGCGIARGDIETAFLRHATSKICFESDLEKIMTLGFRGEALAAVSAVSNVTLVTKTASEPTGTEYTISGGVGGELCDHGCPNGTVITVEDLFFNMPARMKFLKKDVTEGNAVATVIERLSLSHPEIAFKFLRDRKLVMSTSGDGKLISAVYSVCGRQFASSLIELNGGVTGVGVNGFICKPVSCKPNRNSQYVFLNGRFIKSATVTAALEQAYKNSVMVGKFPAAVLFISISPELVDVNVHPAKTEVRFSNEKLVFDAVYSAVKNTLLTKDERPEFTHKTASQVRMPADEYKQLVMRQDKPDEKQISAFIDHITETAPPKRGRVIEVHYDDLEKDSDEESEKLTFFDPSAIISYKDYLSGKRGTVESAVERYQSMPVVKSSFEKVPFEKPDIPAADEYKSPNDKPAEYKPADNKHDEPEKTVPVLESRDIRYIGEIFATYIIAQLDGDVYLIDKHAAHERILFNKLKSSAVIEQQMLLSPEIVTLSSSDRGAILENIETVNDSGFEIEDFGNGNLIVRAVPACLVGIDIADLMSELAENLRKKYTAEFDRIDDLYHSMACKAAIKAGYISDKVELEKLAKTVLSDDEIMYCPHGRPVAVKLTKAFIERQFGRIQ